MEKRILTLNGGSSSIKFALYVLNGTLELKFTGQLKGIGSKKAVIKYGESENTAVKAADHDEAVKSLVDWLEEKADLKQVTAIGHRIVHGMQHVLPEKITPKLIAYLKSISAYDPEHLPEEIKLMEFLVKRFPSIDQVACFDTAFHSEMPVIAKILPIPRRYYKKGIHKYGFHGLSYAYLMNELDRLGEGNGKIIMAHLGSGASLAAVKDGKCIDTSMGFTPAGGIPMSSRSGDLDPGVAWYLMQSEKLTAKQFSHLINHESGLLGISDKTADMSELLSLKGKNSAAAEAVEVFCYQVRKWIGSFSAALGGLNTLVFAGGIGEASAGIRAMICAELGFLGIEIDPQKNMGNESTISAAHGKVTIKVIRTNEELMIAKTTCNILKYKIKQ